MKKDQRILEDRLKQVDKLMMAVGQKITSEETKTLILKKLQDLVNMHLELYINREKRALVNIGENLFDKYAIPLNILELKHEEYMKQMSKFLVKLGYPGQTYGQLA